MARMAVAHTTHRFFSASGAQQRAARRYLRTLIVRSRLVAAATRLQAYLPPEMAARLKQGPPELKWPKHPSQVAFEAKAASTACDVSAGGGGAERMAGRSPGQAPGDKRRARPEKTPLMPNWRAAERAAALAEVAARAPWREAIAFARAAKRAARAAKRTDRARLAPVKAHRTRCERIKREPAAPVAGSHADGDGPATGCAVAPRPGPDSLLVEINPLWRELAFRAAGLRARSNGQPADARRPDTVSTLCDINPLGREGGDGASLAPQPAVAPRPDPVSTLCDINPLGPEGGDGRSLARQPAVARPPDPVSTRCDINPLGREGGGGPSLARQPAVARRPDPISTRCDINPLGREAGSGPSLARLRLRSTKAMALRSTTLAGTWAPRVRALLAAAFGHPTPPGWRAPQVLPVGWAAIPGGGEVPQHAGRVPEGTRQVGPAAGGRPGGRECAPGMREPAGKRGRHGGG